MSARWKRTLVIRAAATCARASSSEAAEMSTEVNRAPGLVRASVTVCDPTPQPASSTRLPSGYAVSQWSNSTSESAWSCSRMRARSS